MDNTFVVPDSIPVMSTPVDSLRVPDTVSGENIKMPEWDYNNYGPFAIFHTKIGIASIASILTFGILSTLNPPFVQESRGENRIETKKPCMTILYIVSLVVFIFIMIVPVNPSPTKNN